MNIGIIGFGRIGAEHAGWLDRSRRARATVVFDPTPARRALAESRGLRTVDSIDALLNDASIDAVLVSTPTSLHFEHAMAALSANKHVMIEKPMAMEFSQAEKIYNESLSRKRLVSVFHNRRWDIDYLTVEKAVRSGIFGKIINVESRLGQWGSCVGPAAREFRPNWRNEAAWGGGALFDWGSHFLDQLWQLMLPARPQRIFAQLRGNVWSRDCDDFARVVIDFDNGAVGMVEINTTTMRFGPRWHIDGAEGSANSPASTVFDTQKWAELDFYAAGGAPPQRLPLAVDALSESEIWDRFAQYAPAVPVETVLPTMWLLQAARRSSQEGIAISCNAMEKLFSDG